MGSYWRSLLLRTSILLLIWFLVGPVMGILFVEQMNALRIGGIPLGFWISQQGAIYVFVVLIFANAWLAEREDRRRAAEAPGGGAR
jgi:putative solute:sodium symporter small subunit